jgi:hypothetical protein
MELPAGLEVTAKAVERTDHWRRTRDTISWIILDKLTNAAADRVGRTEPILPRASDERFSAPCN